jgi:hypothetical protein
MPQSKVNVHDRFDSRADARRFRRAMARILRWISAAGMVESEADCRAALRIVGIAIG